MKILSAIPFFRILLPFVAGILTSIALDCTFDPWWLLAALLLTSIFLILKDNSAIKWTLMLCADLFLFIYGLTLVSATNMSVQKNFYGNHADLSKNQQYLAVITDLPVTKPKSVKCALEITHVKRGGKFIDVNGKVIGYFRKSRLAASLREGQTLILYGRMSEVPPPLNPFEFDYRKYLKRKQISHTLFVDSNSFAQFDGRGPGPLWSAGLGCKRFILTRLKESDLSQSAYAICTALLTGYDDDIEKPVMDAFSHSGTLHVLSVSGLHTGLIYLALNVILGLIDKKQKYKVLRFVIITISLWSFALITGFSAPVLRAVIMFNLLGFGKIYFRSTSRNQLNVLFVSAFILLCFDPWLITDVGFLLSYFAMFGLLYYQPLLSDTWQPQNYFARQLWVSITASVSATISTLPITLFVFKQFPLWFFICNIVVVPATFVLLLLAVLVIFNVPLISHLVNGIIQFLIFFIDLFNSDRLGYIDSIYFTFTDALILSALILIVTAAIHYRSYHQLRLAFCIIICWQFYSLFETFFIKKDNLLTVYQAKDLSAISVKNHQQIILNPIDSNNFNFHVKPHLVSFNNPEITFKSFNYLEMKGRKLLLLGEKNGFVKADVAQVDLLVVTGNFKLTESVLAKLPDLEKVICDGSNNTFIRGHTEYLCRKFGIDFYDTKQKGAFLLEL